MGFYYSLFRFTGIASVSLLITACSTTHVQTSDLPGHIYYEKAQKALHDNLPAIAVEYLQNLNSHYPFGEYSTRAKLDLIYAQYSVGDYIAAHEMAKRFINSHPEHEDISYAYYMKALSTYKSSQGSLERYLGIDPSKRDTSDLKRAFEEFADFLSRYPNSQFAPDAKALMNVSRNIVAHHELQVARYYLKHQAPLSALLRGQAVIDHYPSSSSVEEALVTIIQSYNDLHLPKLAVENLAVLKKNFPKSYHIDAKGSFIPLSLPSDANPGFWYWTSFGLISK